MGVEVPTLTIPLARAWILPTRVTVYCPAGTGEPVNIRVTVPAATLGVANALPSINAGESASMSAPLEKAMTSGEEIATLEVNCTWILPHDPETHPLDTVTLSTR